MKRFIFTTFLLAYIFMPQTAYAACNLCTAFYCENPAAAKKALERKKNMARSQGLPERLISLFDRLPNCVGCVENTPDWVHVSWSVDEDKFEEATGRLPGFSTRSMPWSANLEQQLRNDMRKGIVTEFHIYHYSGPPCKCCPDTNKKDMTSWQREQSQSPKNITGYNQTFDFHPKTGLSFTNPKGLGKDPKDLTEIADAYKRADTVKAPPLEDYMPPIVRVVQVQCKDCQRHADKYNKIGKELNDMRRSLAEMTRDIHYARQLIASVWKELEGINKTAFTKKTDKKRKSLMDELGGHQRALEKYQKRLKKKREERAALELELADVMAQMKICEENGCKEKEACHFPSDGKDKAIKIGSNATVGTGAKIKGDAKSKALGSLMGGGARGGFSMGGGGMKRDPMAGIPKGSSGKGPKTEKDPTKGKFTRLSAGGTDLDMRGQMTKEDLVISSKLKKSPGNGTFHALWLEDKNGKIYLPKRYFIIRLYQKWSLQVSWTYDRWVNNEHVEHREGDSLTVGTKNLGTYKFFSNEKGVARSIWHSLGFDHAVKGVQHLGAVFDVPPAILKDPCGLKVVTHTSLPKQDPVMTQPITGHVSLADDGKNVLIKQ